MSELICERIRAHVTRLGLTHLSEPGTIETLTARADTEKMGYLDLVDLLLEEVGIREGRMKALG